MDTSQLDADQLQQYHPSWAQTRASEWNRPTGVHQSTGLRMYQASSRPVYIRNTLGQLMDFNEQVRNKEQMLGQIARGAAQHNIYHSAKKAFGRKATISRKRKTFNN